MSIVQTTQCPLSAVHQGCGWGGGHNLITSRSRETRTIEEKATYENFSQLSSSTSEKSQENWNGRQTDRQT
jgi:hypothetical protein